MAISDPHSLQKREIRLGTASVSLEYEPAFAGLISFLFPHAENCAEQQGSGIQAAKYTLLSERASGEVIFSRNGAAGMRISSGEAAATHIMDRVCYDLVDACSDGLVLHAAMVAKNGRGLILPASSGSGKSTLTAWLVREGFEYGSDELVYAPFGVKAFNPFGRPINLKQRARQRTDSIFGFSEALYQDRDEVVSSPPVDFISSKVFGPGRILGAVVPTAVIFSKFTPDAENSFHKISKGRAGLEWMQHLLNARNLSQHGFSEIAGLARILPAYFLAYSSLNQITGIFEKLCFD